MALTHPSLGERVVNLRSLRLSPGHKAGNRRHLPCPNGVDGGQGVRSESNSESRGPQCNTQSTEWEPIIAEGGSDQ